MKLSEIFSQLAYGELSQLAVVNEAGDGILETRQGQMVAHVNLGLTALYKRFPLKEGRTILELRPGLTTYLLSTLEDTTFQEDGDTTEFLDDILKIERVYTDAAVDPYEFPLNDLSERYSLFTPTATTLRVPADIVAQGADLPEYLVTSTLTLMYRANHPAIVYKTGFNPVRVEVQLPASHLEPLLLYVASRVNTPTGMTGEFNAGNNYYAKYEAACQQLESLNLRVDQGSQSNRLTSNGWV